MLLLRHANCLVQRSPCGHVTAQKCYFLGTKSPCGNVTAQKCYFLVTKKPLRACHRSKIHFVGTKKNLRACYCSEILFSRYKKNLQACYCSEMPLSSGCSRLYCLTLHIYIYTYISHSGSTFDHVTKVVCQVLGGERMLAVTCSRIQGPGSRILD